MYQGNNPTALRSQEWLAESLVKLLNEKPYESITIKDIYTHADLSRQTFYNLFSGKEEVLRFYLSTIYLPFLKWLDAQKNLVMEAVMGRLISILEKNKSIVSIMMDNHLELILVECTNPVVDALSNRLFHVEQNTKETLYMRALVSGAIVNVIICWMKEGMLITSEELNEIIQEFLERVYSQNP